MDYESIYYALCKRGKSRRVKRAYWGAWHRHHIVPRSMGGANTSDNITKLQIKEHALAHRLLYKMYGRWQDMVAYSALRNQECPWEDPEYRKHMLPKVINNLSKADPVLAGERAGAVAKTMLHMTIHTPESRAKSIAGRRKWVEENLEKAAAQAAHLHTEATVRKMSASRSRYTPIGPDGTRYTSIREASAKTGIKRTHISNWIIRGHFGWSRQLKTQ